MLIKNDNAFELYTLMIMFAFKFSKPPWQIVVILDSRESSGWFTSCSWLVG
jgi:hypothetical protein